MSVSPGGRSAAGRRQGITGTPTTTIVVPLAAGRMRVTAAAGDISVHTLEKGVPYYREAGAEHMVRSDIEGVLDFIEVEILHPPPAP